MTHRYKVELRRIFRGHPIALGRPEFVEIGAKAPDRTLIAKAKAAFGMAGIKSNKEDRGNEILLKFKGCKTHQLSIQFCS